jgi:hypothetical protein
MEVRTSGMKAESSPSVPKVGRRKVESNSDLIWPFIICLILVPLVNGRILALGTPGRKLACFTNCAAEPHHFFAAPAPG